MEEDTKKGGERQVRGPRLGSEKKGEGRTAGRKEREGSFKIYSREDGLLRRRGGDGKDIS